LFGGDTVRTPGPLMVSITAFGSLPQGTMVHRAGARAGDRILVTGTIGDAALGLRLRKGEQGRTELPARHADHLLARYLVPQPRNALAQAVRRYATASMDVSDGLVGDLGKLCRESGVGAEIRADAVPLSEAAQAFTGARPELLATALTGGDDYEILCTVPDRRIAAFMAEAAAAQIAATVIGHMLAGAPEARLLGVDGKALQFATGSFSHF
jgi:thiamine-monophosphate kinase